MNHDGDEHRPPGGFITPNLGYRLYPRFSSLCRSGCERSEFPDILSVRTRCFSTLAKSVKPRCFFYPAYHIFANRDTETIQPSGHQQRWPRPLPGAILIPSALPVAADLQKDLEVLQKILLHKEENDIIIKGGNHNVSKS